MRMLSPTSTDLSWSRRHLSSDHMVEAFSDFDQIVDSFLQPKFAKTANFQPACDINEDKDHYLVTFDIPGVRKEDVKIEVQGNDLVVSGERQSDTNKNSNDVALYRERVYGKFERTFVIPGSVDANRIEAHHENGVLSVVLPKLETAKPRAIQIQTNQDGIFRRLLGSKKEISQDLKEVKSS